jgi:hypothetical protein
MKGAEEELDCRVAVVLTKAQVLFRIHIADPSKLERLDKIGDGLAQANEDFADRFIDRLAKSEGERIAKAADAPETAGEIGNPVACHLRLRLAAIRIYQPETIDALHEELAGLLVDKTQEEIASHMAAACNATIVDFIRRGVPIAEAKRGAALTYGRTLRRVKDLRAEREGSPA